MRLRRQIDLVENSGEWFPDELEFEGNRAIVCDESDEPPRPTLAVYVAASLTFHRNKQKPRAPTPRGGESERARQRRGRSTTWGE